MSYMIYRKPSKASHPLFWYLTYNVISTEGTNTIRQIQKTAPKTECHRQRKDADYHISRARRNQKGPQGTHAIPLGKVWKTVKHYRRWPHLVSTFAAFSTWSPLTTYTPSIIMSFGFDRIHANALAAVGSALAPVVALLFATLSDYTDQRGMAVMSAQVCYLIALLVGRQMQGQTASPWAHWALWTAINAFAVGYHPAHNTWLQLNCHEAEERSVSIAMWVMSANTGMMVGTWYYRGEDKPSYNNGLLIQICMVSFGLAAAMFQEATYIIHNRRAASGKHGVRPRVYVP
ncbi:major facilitator superfamily domain-containing protein [Diplogelasinospora grovesii]|uniref:Major facilitator superfamily domain-containing protein n=1 Tax=Diplogelasinospora grovesii TaxID=303347 RepID=A0AAN6S5B8_9PEZI|nr:major facilitator superfamily domain-containing protein [Diplogelasinospora grovesii]